MQGIRLRGRAAPPANFAAVAAAFTEVSRWTDEPGRRSWLVGVCNGAGELAGVGTLSSLVFLKTLIDRFGVLGLQLRLAGSDSQREGCDYVFEESRPPGDARLP